MPAGRGSTSASGAASPSSRSDRRHEHDLPRRARPSPSRRWPRPVRWRSAWRRPATIALHRARAPLQLRLLAERGAHEHAPAADELVATARESGRATAARAGVHGRRAPAARPGAATARQARCWSSSRRLPEIHADPYYAASLARARAHRARPPPARARHAARGRCRAAHAPRRARALAPPAPSSPRPPDDHAEAAALYAEAAERWREFGNVPERAYALLGQGRCLPRSAARRGEPLREARELFASMGYRPALAETDALLGESEAAATSP